MEQYLKEPIYAGLFGSIVTIIYMHTKARINNEVPPSNSMCFKPAVLVGILVYYIVSMGVAAKETISSDPY